MMNEKKKLELYIHIPFCKQKCSYCDFLSAPADEDVQKSYVNQLIEEIRMQAICYPDYQITTIFFGGGTPSILNGQWISNIMGAIYESFAVEADAEITIECNPGTLDQEKLGHYRESGINRISLGLQSADDEELKLLGRIHTYDDFLKSYQEVREAGFKNVNVDLISALPNQTTEKWKNTLRKTLMLKPEHISAYSLIIEEGTPFFKTYGKFPGSQELPDEETDREMYAETKEILKEHEYERYEISNYALPGFACRHNIGYWTGVEYLGVGLGASSFVMDRRFHSERDLKSYMDIPMHEDLMPLYQDIQELTEEERMEEFMYLGLRMTKGVNGSDFMYLFGRNMFNVFSEQIRRNISMHLLEEEAPFLRLTDRGIDVSNRVFADFYDVLERKEERKTEENDRGEKHEGKGRN